MRDPDLIAVIDMLEDDSLITYLKALEIEIHDLYDRLQPLQRQADAARILVRNRGLEIGET